MGGGRERQKKKWKETERERRKDEVGIFTWLGLRNELFGLAARDERRETERKENPNFYIFSYLVLHLRLPPPPPPP